MKPLIARNFFPVLQNQLRRFQASTFQTCARKHMFITQIPLRLEPGWNKIELNLADFTQRTYEFPLSIYSIELGFFFRQ